MSYLHACLSQTFSQAELAAAVRSALGKPLRRASTLTQLALVGALACAPTVRRTLPTRLFWQSASGPHQETLTLLDEIAAGGEPMPYHFLATQPALAAAQIQPWLPGLHHASHHPLENERESVWSTLLMLAADELAAPGERQALCAQLDAWGDCASGHWLLLGNERLDNSLAKLDRVENTPPNAPDHPALPYRLADWLAGNAPALRLRAPAAFRQTVEFVRL